MYIPIVLFAIITFFVFYTAAKQFYRIYQNIHLGKPENIGGHAVIRWKNVLLVAFGQQKMFKKLIPAVLHLFIYLAFLLTQIELIEILVDGTFGVHRFFSHYLGGFYTFVIGTIELLSALALVATFAFLIRRNI
ncbi:MAG: Fe-S oxidoreductase, partial [Saprospiraceae bacterium]